MQLSTMTCLLTHALSPPKLGRNLGMPFIQVGRKAKRGGVLVSFCIVNAEQAATERLYQQNMGHAM